jgi:hypothetical protein
MLIPIRLKFMNHGRFMISNNEDLGIRERISYYGTPQFVDHRIPLGS